MPGIKFNELRTVLLTCREFYGPKQTSVSTVAKNFVENYNRVILAALVPAKTAFHGLALMTNWKRAEEDVRRGLLAQSSAVGDDPYKKVGDRYDERSRIRFEKGDQDRLSEMAAKIVSVQESPDSESDQMFKGLEAIISGLTITSW